ncbi:tRNA lysidine(34) synthetase TilS [Rhodoligotrophos ferricapiens]|uniref:tRNA lysidine(34) synthetase TilS n=1 Tax=Rhodoligotrophos ferricapiens TaxID=3069264 RepID=UPI00315D1008
MTPAKLASRFAAWAGLRHIALAVSGGADSTALMYMVAAWKAAHSHAGPVVTVLTVDHRLRKSAADEARQVASQAHALGFDHHILVWRGTKPKTGIQAAARAARYELLADWCRANAADCLATAHTRDDQAETVLMRLAHGSGLDGLTGMAASSDIDGVPLLRPLLDLSREALREMLTSQNLPFADDPSNADERFERVRIRQKRDALAEIGLDAEAVTRTAGRLRDAADALDHITDQIVARTCERHAGGFALIDREPLRDIPREILRRVLARAVRAIGGHAYPLRYEKLVEIADLLQRDDHLSRTVGGCRLVTRRQRLCVAREWGRMDQSWHPLVGGMIWDDRLRIQASEPDELTTIGPLGEEEWPRLRAANPEWSRIPAFIARTLPALRHKGELAAVPYLRHSRGGPTVSLEFKNKDLAMARPVDYFAGEQI